MMIEWPRELPKMISEGPALHPRPWPSFQFDGESLIWTRGISRKPPWPPPARKYFRSMTVESVPLVTIRLAELKHCPPPIFVRNEVTKYTQFQSIEVSMFKPSSLTSFQAKFALLAVSSILHCSERKSLLQMFVMLAADDRSFIIQEKWCFAYCLEIIVVNGDDHDLSMQEDVVMLSFSVLLFTNKVVTPRSRA